MRDTESVHDTTREYIQVTPSTEEFEFVNIQQLSSLHQLTTGDDGGGALSSLNPFSGGEHPVTVEFLALTTGDEGAVELYYGADAELDVLQRRLESIYPHTFDIERMTMDPRKRLVEPMEFSIEEFVDLLRDGRLRVDYDDLTVDAASALEEPDRPALESPDPDGSEEELADGGATPDGTTPMDTLFGEDAADTVQQEAAIQSVYAQEPLDEDPADTEESNTRGEGWNRPLRALDDPSVIDLGDEYVIVAPPEDCPPPSKRADLAGPTATGNGTILARPALSETAPEGLRWHGAANRKKDWMTAMETAADAPTADQPRRNDERPNQSAVLTSIVETLHTADVPTAFQVLFKRKPDWSVSASKRKKDLKNNRDTRLQRVIQNVTGPVDRDDDRDLPASISRRQELIDAKTPKRTFTVNCRAVSVAGRPQPTRGTDGEDVVGDATAEPTQAIDGLEPALDPMAGAYYQLEPHRTAAGDGLFGGSLSAEDVLGNLLERTLTTRDKEKSTLGKVASSAKSKPDIVLNARELSDLAVVPSAEEFRVDAFRATQATHEIDNPLPRPSQQLLDQFDHGMAAGLPLDDLGQPAEEPVRIPPSVLQRHYARFGATGAGKSIASTNDLLSIHAATDGLSILAEPKGDGMCQDYLRCHYRRFGTLEDVYLFEVPDVVPALSFFDIRPALAAGRSREDAIQDKLDHFHAVMEMLMGEVKYNQAYVATQVISFLIKALFDPEYGADAFTIDDLLDAAFEMQRERRVPPVAADRVHVEDMLVHHFQRGDHDFQQTMEAVINRLSKIKENTTIAKCFEHVPEWNAQRETYARESTAFSFSELLDEDAVVLFDMGPLRRRTQKGLTLLLLSNLWTSLQSATQSAEEDRDIQTNLILEEAAPFAASELVTEQLLPQSRSFGLSLGFVMQFPTQVEMENSRAYQELLNNVQSTLYSTITKQDDVGEILATGEFTAEEMAEKLRTIPRGHWVADLPSPAFDESPPRPFSMKALPVPPGHPESDTPLDGRYRERFEQFALPDCRREARRFGLTSDDTTAASQATTPDDEQVEPRTNRDSSPFASQERVDIDSVLADTAAEASEGGESDEANPSFGPDGPDDVQPAETAIEGGEPPSDGTEGDGHSRPSTDVSHHADAARSRGDTQPSAESESAGDEPESGYETVEGVLTEARAINAEYDGSAVDAVKERNERLVALLETARESGIDVTYDQLLDAGTDPSTSSEGGGSEIASNEDTPPDEPEPANTEDSTGHTQSPTLPEAYSDTTDAELASNDLTRDDEQFLAMVLSAMNRSLEDYSLVKSMTTIRDRVGDPNIETLEAKDFLEVHKTANIRYYTVLPDGRDFLNRPLKHGEGVGDLGEKTPHKAGVEHLRQRFEQLEDVEETTVYYQLHEETVLDVAAFDKDGDICHAGEVETPSNNRVSVVDDYEKLADIGSSTTTWWLTPTGTTATEVLKILIDAGHCPDLPSSDIGSITAIQPTIAELDLPGMDEVRSYAKIREHLDV